MRWLWKESQQEAALAGGARSYAITELASDRIAHVLGASKIERKKRGSTVHRVHGTIARPREHAMTAEESTIGG